MGQLLDLVRLLGLDDPQRWTPPPPPDFVGPVQPPPEPPPLTGWRKTADDALAAVVGTVKGATGLGDQGPAGPTWTNAAQVLGAGLPFLGKLPRFAQMLETYHTPGQAPFYSRLDDAVGSLNAQAAPAKVLSVAKGATTAEEVAARGLPEFVAGYGTKPVPKAALVEHLAAHPVKLEVKTLGGPHRNDYEALVTQMEAKYGVGYSVDALTDAEHDAVQRAWEAVQQRGGGIANQPKFAGYQVPGGTNYKETLITLPETESPRVASLRRQVEELTELPAAVTTYKGEDRTAAFDRLQREFFAAGGTHERPGGFRSSHFDEPNIVVHTRSNERTIPDLGKGTFLEEVQSDWHQKGKAGGYATGDNLIDGKDYAHWDARANDLFDRRSRGVSSNAERATLERDLATARENRNRLSINAADVVPDAPFKDTWPDLAFKHHLAEAAQNPDTHWLGFTSGETQKQRYKEALLKEVNELHYNPETHRLIGNKREAGNEIVHRPIDKTVAPNQLAGEIGKEMAQRLMAAEPNVNGLRTLKGEDFVVGGEGMTAFYDNLLPKRLQKIIEKYGGKVERTKLNETEARRALIAQNEHYYERGAISEATYLQRKAENEESVYAWIVRLTPEIKARILKEGIPLFTGAVLAGSASQQAGEPPQKQTR